MKQLTCRDVGGACDEVFFGETIEEIGGKAKAHVMENMDEAHQVKMEEMKMMSTEEQQQKWQGWLEKFNAAPNVE